MLEREVGCKVWSVEGGINRAVRLSVHVDVTPHIDVGIALVYGLAIVSRTILDEEKMVFAVVGKGTGKAVADSNSSRLACEQFEVDTRLGVWIECCMKFKIFCHNAYRF